MSAPPKCSMCKDLDPQNGDDDGVDVNFHRNITPKQLEESAESCPLCSIILRGVAKFTPDWIRLRDHVNYQFRIGAWMRKATRTLECQIHIRDTSFLREGDALRPYQDRGPTIYLAYLEFYTSEDQEPACKAFGRARTVPNHTFAPFEPGGLVHHWLETCKSSHEKCRIAAQQALPTRVIDVLGNDGSKGQPFLYESQGEIEPYVCLSYCWGGISFLRTTSATLEQRKTCIAPEELPQTLSDAIWITRSLGMRYLWIDALCIIQDDPEDWKRESSSMITVYGHSYLTIAASEAHNAASGMFYATQYTVDNPAQVMVTYSEDPQASVIVRKRLPHWEGETESPLSQRGWAFQESILPKRLIRVGLFEPLWECNETSTCCCTTNPQNNEGLNAKIASSLGHINDITASKRWNIWSEIVHLYSSRALTRGTDKLVALSGIANSIQAMWNCR